MPEKPEVIPADEYVRTVMSQIAQPTLDQLAEELSHPLSISFELFLHDELVDILSTIQSADAESGKPQHGRGRLRFRDTFIKNRYLFCLDVVCVQDDRAPSFSGFRVHGDVRPRENRLIAKAAGLVVRHNDPEFHRWI